ncbi:hypothetical protein RDI58_010440 [Solanum bulbocastanum]|uniref:Uncharacterized protein n=1 Tax=Solanum bulbocastanum TaxID=147425 RepID=A0AAN8TQZ2_SOLBU
MGNYLSILIKHGERWDPSGKYVDFQRERIIYESSSLYSGLDSVVVLDRRHSHFSRSLTNFDLYSNNSIHLIGMNLDGVVDENTDEGIGVISDLSNLFTVENQIYKDKGTLMEITQHYGVVEKIQISCISF